MLPTITLVCGYRRTGKDMLFNILSNPDESSSRFKWRIYKHPDKLDKTFKSANTKYMRTSFADALKREASAQYGIPLSISDADKDKRQFTHYSTGETVSARDIYIEWGAIRREQDLNYWCKSALAVVPNDRTANCVVTDWRFRNEAIYALNTFNNVITVRIYRSDVPEPAMDIESEHNLDTYTTDFLLLRDKDDEEFIKAVRRFPQYANYIACESI